MNTKFLTKTLEGSLAPAEPTRVQQAKKKQRRRVKDQIQVKALSKKLQDDKDNCPHEIGYLVPGVPKAILKCLVCDSEIPYDGTLTAT